MVDAPAAAAPAEPPPPPPPYVLDTSSWIEGYVETYRPSVFKRLWQDIERLLGEKQIVLAEAAYKEVIKQDDDLKKWISRLSAHVEHNNQSIEQQHAAIQAHPIGVALITKGKPFIRSDADSRIIATAMFRRGTVVTKELPAVNLAKAKIPNVCDHFRVPCVNFMRMLELLDLRYE